MMPSSGARSGTKPSRSERGAGSGRVMESVRLACGHEAKGAPVVSSPLRRYWCEDCHALVGETR